jgi:hypothetical protein
MGQTSSKTAMPAAPHQAQPGYELHQFDFMGVLIAGGEGGIPSTHPKKFSVAMVKLKSFVVNERIVGKPFCQRYWEI